MASGFDPAERVRLIHATLRDELRKGLKNHTVYVGRFTTYGIIQIAQV